VAINKVFIGYDKRSPLAYTVLQHSIISNSSQPISITPLIIEQLPVKKTGITEFSFSRFLVPYLCDYEGWGLFLDSDMVVTGDVTELFDDKTMWNDDSVYIVKDQPRFEWCSMMLFNNERCKNLDLDYLNSDKDVRSFEWANGIGELPKEWNHCVGYQKEAPDTKLFHYTQGIPFWEETEDLEPEPWHKAWYDMGYTESWEDIMGFTVHAEKVKERLENRVPTYISEDYKELQKQLHEKGNYGVTGKKYGRIVSRLVNENKIKSLLDYGCGSNLSLVEGLDVEAHYYPYDPCVEEYSAPPKPAEMVVCCDVLEHIEPEYLDAVLDHIKELTDTMLFASVNTGPALTH